MYCKTCVFYRPPEKLDKLFPAFSVMGDCENQKIKYSKAINSAGNKVRPILDGVFYTDAECYSASLIVGPDFGCIHWKAR